MGDDSLDPSNEQDGNSNVWYAEVDPENSNQTTGFVILPEQKGNRIHLHTAIRKYTGATLTFLRNNNASKHHHRHHVVKVELSKLYDALGLLRSLQYDVKCYNQKPTTRYWRFRLTRQAAAFGVRLSRDEDIVIPGLDSLILYIETEHADAILHARSDIEAGIVDFDALQEYFIPGKLVVDRGVATGISNIPTMMRVRACYYARGKSLMGIVSSFHIALETVVAAGDDSFIVVEFQSLQPQFNGSRSITTSIDMFTVPSERLEQEMTKRGQQYQTLCGTKDVTTGSGRMVQYSAGSFLSVGKASSRQGASRLGGRMMVDTVSAWGKGVNCAVHNGTACHVIISSLKIYHQTRAQKQQKADSTHSLEYSTAAQTLADDGDELNDLLILPSPLPEELLALTWPVVAGFSFAARSWGVAMVNGVTAIRYDDGIFESVVLPPQRKKLIQALVSNHSEHKSADLIAGKGEGSIFLLYGPPGVGKTLTAEAIAEMLHKPLYVVSMGELGTSPESLESRLQDILDLCIPWKALVLIDEAEMLLERRTKNDIVRNAMVCVMLRLLEYYSGILFLTTNRVESLDPAFQSRVTCALRYDPLTAQARAQIWNTMLQKLEIDTAEIDVEELAQADINGRQIKNTLQLAAALARHDSVPVGQAHLRETLAVTTSFLRETTSDAGLGIEL